MKVKLINDGTSANIEEHIGRMAAECYDSKTDRESCVRRAAHCVDSGHLATLRFAYATFKVSGISRVCSHQLVRVAHAGILQRSQRYVKESAVEYIDPPILESLSLKDRVLWKRIQDDAANMYLRLVDTGAMKKEDARYILPHGCTTSLNITGNLQMWRDLLKNRTVKHAQWEVRAVAQAIQNELHDLAPNLFKRIES